MWVSDFVYSCRLPGYTELLLNVHFHVTHEEFPSLIYYLDDLIKSNHIRRTVLFSRLGKIHFPYC